MSAYQDSFKRYEKKYLLDKKQLNQFKLLTSLYMQEDDFGTHTINNIYYDTEDYTLIRNSIEKPIYKEKLRVRSYGIPKADDLVFIEIKKKYKGVVYKRRVQMSLNESEHYLQETLPPSEDGQILHEIDWFMNHYHPSPKVFIGYERTAYFAKDDPNLRITFDQNIRYRESDLDLSKGSYGFPLMRPEQTLMEIKIPGVMPLWLSQMLTRLEIFPTSFSKYGNCYKSYLKNHVHLEGGTRYA